MITQTLSEIDLLNRYSSRADTLPSATPAKMSAPPVKLSGSAASVKDYPVTKDWKISDNLSPVQDSSADCDTTLFTTGTDDQSANANGDCVSETDFVVNGVSLSVSDGSFEAVLAEKPSVTVDFEDDFTENAFDHATANSSFADKVVSSKLGASAQLNGRKTSEGFSDTSADGSFPSMNIDLQLTSLADDDANIDELGESRSSAALLKRGGNDFDVGGSKDKERRPVVSDDEDVEDKEIDGTGSNSIPVIVVRHPSQLACRKNIHNRDRALFNCVKRDRRLRRVPYVKLTDCGYCVSKWITPVKARKDKSGRSPSDKTSSHRKSSHKSKSSDSDRVRRKREEKRAEKREEKRKSKQKKHQTETSDDEQSDDSVTTTVSRQKSSAKRTEKREAEKREEKRKSKQKKQQVNTSEDEKSDDSVLFHKLAAKRAEKKREAEHREQKRKSKIKKQKAETSDDENSDDSVLSDKPLAQRAEKLEAEKQRDDEKRREAERREAEKRREAEERREAEKREAEKRKADKREAEKREANRREAENHRDIQKTKKKKQRIGTVSSDGEKSDESDYSKKTSSATHTKKLKTENRQTEKRDEMQNYKHKNADIDMSEDEKSAKSVSLEKFPEKDEIEKRSEKKKISTNNRTVVSSDDENLDDGVRLDKLSEMHRIKEIQRDEKELNAKPEMAKKHDSQKLETEKRNKKPKSRHEISDDEKSSKSVSCKSVSCKSVSLKKFPEKGVEKNETKTNKNRSTVSSDDETFDDTDQLSGKRKRKRDETQNIKSKKARDASNTSDDEHAGNSVKSEKIVSHPPKDTATIPKKPAKYAFDNVFGGMQSLFTPDIIIKSSSKSEKIIESSKKSSKRDDSNKDSKQDDSNKDLKSNVSNKDSKRDDSKKESKRNDLKKLSKGEVSKKDAKRDDSTKDAKKKLSKSPTLEDASKIAERLAEFAKRSKHLKLSTKDTDVKSSKKEKFKTPASIATDDSETEEKLLDKKPAKRRKSATLTSDKSDESDDNEVSLKKISSAKPLSNSSRDFDTAEQTIVTNKPDLPDCDSVKPSIDIHEPVGNVKEPDSVEILADKPVSQLTSDVLEETSDVLLPDSNSVEPVIAEDVALAEKAGNPVLDPVSDVTVSNSCLEGSDETDTVPKCDTISPDQSNPDPVSEQDIVEPVPDPDTGKPVDFTPAIEQDTVKPDSVTPVIEQEAVKQDVADPVIEHDSVLPVIDQDAVKLGSEGDGVGSFVKPVPEVAEEQPASLNDVTKPDALENCEKTPPSEMEDKKDTVTDLESSGPVVAGGTILDGPIKTSSDETKVAMSLTKETGKKRVSRSLLPSVRLDIMPRRIIETLFRVKNISSSRSVSDLLTYTYLLHYLID